MGENVYPEHLNAGGDVVGYEGYNNIPDGPNAFLYSGGHLQLLAAPAGYASSDAHWINDSKIIVGSVSANGFTHAARFEPGTAAVLLGGPEGNNGGNIAVAVNDAGTILGQELDQCNSGEILLYMPDGSATDTGVYGDALSINSSGTVLYSKFTAPFGNCEGYYVPMLYPLGQEVALPANAEFTEYTNGVTSAFLSDHGDVAGNYTAALSPPGVIGSAFYTQAGIAQQIVAPGTGPVSVALFGMNNSGDVIGISGYSTGTLFAWKSGAFVDIVSMIRETPPGFTIATIGAINDNGEIAGTGSYQNAEHGYLLVPLR